MRYLALLLLAATASGCATGTYAEVTALRGGMPGTGRLPQSKQVLDLDATLVRVGGVIDLAPDSAFVAELGAGLQALDPHGHEPIPGVDASLRLGYDWGGCQLFVQGTAGYLHMGDNPLGPYRSDYLFSNGLAVGVAVPLDESTTLSVGYQVYHGSNGDKFHGKGRLRKVGLDPKGANPGFEGGGLFIGLEVRF
jgi:hypothetical protein